MRIGVDCQAMQTSASRQRGIGIYARMLLQHLTSEARDQYHLFFNSALDLPDAPVAFAQIHTVSYAEPHASHESQSLNEYLQRLAYESHDLDLLHIPSAQEGAEAVIERWRGRRSFPVVCTLYDLIPLVFPHAYLTDHVQRELYERGLEVYRHADVILAISEHSRHDLIRLLRVPNDRVINVGAAIDPAIHRWEDANGAARIEQARREFGIGARFVLFTGGFDFRKNLQGMIEAFSALPRRLQCEYQLVIVCDLAPEARKTIEGMAERYGIRDSLVLTGWVSQESLVALYNSCELFVFPSLYEGFGLPVLEAMSCGAAVIASSTSSIPEVLGDAGVQVNPADQRAVAEAMQSLLESREKRAELKEMALQRARLFTWEATAQATREAFALARTRWLRSMAVARRRRPRIAFFSPLPPQRSGISDYSAELLPHLSTYFEIDVYLDGSIRPEVIADESIRFLAAQDGVQGYPYFSWLYQIGNNPMHAYMFNVLLQHPGISVLHELSLHSLMHQVFVHLHGSEERYGDELEYEHGIEGRIAFDMLRTAELDGANATRLFPLNQRVLNASKAVIVHSEFGRGELVRGSSLRVTPRVRFIRQGMSVRPVLSSDERRALRAARAIAGDALVIGTFGFMTESKQLDLALAAFGRMRTVYPDALFLGVGEFLSPAYEATIASLSTQLGISDSVRFTGHVQFEEFYNYLNACDVVLSLRHPSRGETSAAMLRALSCGLPTIVNDSAAFSELPDTAVIKVQLGPKQEDELVDALHRLASDPSLRRRMGAAARRYIVDQHSWESVAAQYADYIHNVEATGLGDQTYLRQLLAHLAMLARAEQSPHLLTLDRSVEALAGSEGLGRVVWA